MKIKKHLLHVAGNCSPSPSLEHSVSRFCQRMKRLFFIFCHSSVGRCGLAAPILSKNDLPPSRQGRKVAQRWKGDEILNVGC